MLDAIASTNITSSGNNGGQAGQMTVLGTLRTSGSGTLNLTDGVLYDVSGTAEVNSGTMLFGGSSNLLSHSGTTLSKGTWLVSIATLDFNGRTVQTLGTNATVELSGSSASFTAMNILTQNNSTLRVLGGHTFTPAAATVNNAGLIEVGAGSTFAKGIVVQNNGTLRSGGAATGNLTVNGNLALQSGSMLNLKLNGTIAGTNYDQLTVNGTVDLGNSTIVGNVGYSAAVGDKLFILLNDGSDPITGTFNGLPHGSLVTLGGYTANISYFGDSLTLNTIGGNDVVLFNFSPVPEPGSVLSVVVLAFGTVAGVRRWKAGRRGGPVAVAFDSISAPGTA